MYTKNCLNCSKSFTSKRKDKKFCHYKCRAIYNANIYYNLHKDEPIFKEKSKKRLYEWIKNNRKHFNDLVRDKNKILGRKRIILYKEKGLCSKCGKKIEKFSFDKNLFLCIKCRLIDVKRHQTSTSENRLIKRINKNDSDKQLYEKYKL